MPKQHEIGRAVKLTEAGLKRLHEARRKYKQSLNAIFEDDNTPSVNTVKRALRQGAVFVDTLERIWDYLRGCAEKQHEVLPDLVCGEDYFFVETDESPKPEIQRQTGWLSRHVPRPNRLFTGRRNILDRLRLSLQNGPAALVPDPQALTGLGGIGKTQTAVAYIYEQLQNYRWIFWVNAETVETLDDGLIGLAEELNLLPVSLATQREALRKMHDWFQSESGWLLVLDNADDVETLAPHFPRHHTGSLLLTTRSRNPVKWAAPIEIVKLARNEGALLLLRRAGILSVEQTLEQSAASDLEAALELSDELGGLPLALSQAGACVAETHVSLSEYLEVYRHRGLELLDRYEDGDHKSVTLTFRLALEQIKKHVKEGQAAEELIYLCAFLAPDTIPEAIFVAHFSSSAAEVSAFAAQSPFPDVCAAPCAYSLLHRDATNKTLSVHRLVQKVIRETMSVEEYALWKGRTVAAVAAATPDFEFENWSLCELLLPHWRVCAEYLRGNSLETPQAAYLLYQAGRYLRARTVYNEAESLLCQAIAISEKVHGGENRTLADYLDDLACLYRTIDRGKEAEALHHRALNIVERFEGANHLLTASKLHNLAVFYIQYEDYEAAEALFLRALAIHEEQEYPDQMLIATALTQLGGVYRVRQNFDTAESCCLRALEIYERLLEPAHIEIATGCNNLGLLYLTMGRYADSEGLYRRALAINEQARGKAHPETGTVLWGLARVCWKQGRQDEAQTFFDRALTIYTRHFGQEHVRTAKISSSYTEFQREVKPLTFSSTPK